MRVLKFGGTSVGSVANIKKVLEIVNNSAKDQQVIAVVSALGGITDLLLKTGSLAASGEEYQLELDKIKQRHREFTQELCDGSNEAVEQIFQLLKDLEELLQGISLIHELSPKTIDKLLAFGERMSSTIIGHAMVKEGADAVTKDSRELIFTNDNHTKASVNF